MAPGSSCRSRCHEPFDRRASTSAWLSVCSEHPPGNAAIPAVVKARADAGKHILLGDMYTPFAAVSNDKTVLLKDTWHPNVDGHVILGARWYSVLAASLLRKSNDPKRDQQNTRRSSTARGSPRPRMTFGLGKPRRRS